MDKRDSRSDRVLRNLTMLAIPTYALAMIAALIDAGETPFDYTKDNKALRGTDVYWRLNEARFE